jgi:hypothetical protein
MTLKAEIDVLHDHIRTTQIVVANLVAARERLTVLGQDPRRERLLKLQQDVVDAAGESLHFSQSTLAHLRALASFHASAEKTAV